MSRWLTNDCAGCVGFAPNASVLRRSFALSLPLSLMCASRAMLQRGLKLGLESRIEAQRQA